MSELKGRIFDIQYFAVQDGPGIRTTVFFKGCPLHCPWCHSPESQAFYPQLSWMSQKCVGTAECKNVCIETCPKKALSYGKTEKNSLTGEDKQLVRIDRDLCDNCGECVQVCYPKALSVCGQDYTVGEVMEKARRDLPFFESSGGGVTLSGGECLCQPKFALALLKQLKEEKIHTAVDTTGFVDGTIIESVLPYTDLFLYDLKHMDSETHRAVTGVPNERILENAERIAAAGGLLQVRIPVIPGFNNSRKNIEETGAFCQSLKSAVTCIQLLPYHNLGLMKYLRLKEDAPLFDVKPPSDEEMQRHKETLEAFGLDVTIH